LNIGTPKFLKKYFKKNSLKKTGPFYLKLFFPQDMKKLLKKIVQRVFGSGYRLKIEGLHRLPIYSDFPT